MRIRKMLSRFQLVPKRSTRLTKIVVALTIVLAVVAILVLHSATLNAQAEADAWRDEAQAQEQEKSALEKLFGNLGTLEGIKDIAENLLGLTDPDTVIIQPENGFIGGNKANYGVNRRRNFRG